MLQSRSLNRNRRNHINFATIRTKTGTVILLNVPVPAPVPVQKDLRYGYDKLVLKGIKEGKKIQFQDNIKLFTYSLNRNISEINFNFKIFSKLFKKSEPEPCEGK